MYSISIDELNITVKPTYFTFTYLMQRLGFSFLQTELFTTTKKQTTQRNITTFNLRLLPVVLLDNYKVSEKNSHSTEIKGIFTKILSANF